MIDQVECPYCGCGRNRIDEPMGDDELTEMDCRECGEKFQVASSVSVTYTVYCAEGRCEFKPTPGYPSLLQCARCENFKSNGRC